MNTTTPIPGEQPDANSFEKTEAPGSVSPTPGDPGPVTAPRRPLSGPIIWGVIFLTFCAWAAQQTLFPEVLGAGVWIAGVLVGIGALLLVVGVTVAVRGSRAARPPHSP